MSIPGRNLQRTGRLCESCNARLTYGSPKGSGNWAGALRLTREQHDLLLMAAAEWDEINAEVEEPGDTVAFGDWIAVDVLSHLPVNRKDAA